MWSKLYRKIINYPLAAERCDRMKSRNIASSETGRIHDARGWGVVPDHLAKLLHHHRLRCGDADGIDIRGDYLLSPRQCSSSQRLCSQAIRYWHCSASV